MRSRDIVNICKKSYQIGEDCQDLSIIERDWETIINKIRNGKAHEISEGDTLYLGACTKGASAASYRKQPFSDIPAKQRAYSLKQSYMTNILNSYIFGTETDERIVKDPKLLRKMGFEEYIISKVTPYIGKSQSALLHEFGIVTNAKNVNEIILARILSVQGRITATDEFKKANIIPKTIRIQKNGRIKESMSFPTFRFTEIITEIWDDSELRNYLEPAKFLFVIFRETSENEYSLESLKFWNIPVDDLSEVQKVWERTVQIIKDGVELNFDGRVTHNNLPGQSFNHVAHVRPHGRNAKDTNPLPDGRNMTKQCFWFNNSYVKSIIGN